MAKTTPSADVVDDGDERRARSRTSAGIGKAGTDNVQKAHGRVRPGTMESRSRSRSSSSGGPTKYKQHCKLLLQIGQLLGWMQL